MKSSRIEYNPYKSIKEIAEASHVSEAAVRRYIKTSNIDRKYDEQLIMYRKVEDYMKDHPDCSWCEIARELHISVNTARKYGEMKEPPTLPDGKVSAVDALNVRDALFVSVSGSEGAILRAILAKHLDGEKTFDCDLTVGKGEFYKNNNIPLPKRLYDICPQIDRTKHLDEAFKLHGEVIKSAVIDLPCAVAGPNQRKRVAYNSFSTINKMYGAYGDMITLAHRLLKTDGILVFKTADFAVKKEKIWASDLAIKYAVETGFELADKYIYIDRKAVNAVTSSARRAKVPTHAYFLVFRKPKPSSDTEPSASEQPEQ